MSFCTSCGSEPAPEDRFCARCGTPKAPAGGTGADVALEGVVEQPGVAGATTAHESNRRLWLVALVVVTLTFGAAAFMAVRTSGSNNSSGTTYVPPQSKEDPPALYQDCDTAQEQAIQAMESQGTSDVLVIDIVEVEQLRSDSDRRSDGIAVLCQGKAIVSGGSDRLVRFGVRIESGEAYVFMKDV